MKIIFKYGLVYLLSASAFSEVCLYVSKPKKFEIKRSCAQFLCSADIVCLHKGTSKKSYSADCLSDSGGNCPSDPQKCLADKNINLINTKVFTPDYSNDGNGSSHSINR